MNKYFEFGNRSFIRRTVLITLPVILQQLISIGINFMDNLMIGGFGETQISAAAFGNQFYAILQFICMGLGSGVVVMSSQFWGSKDHKSMRISAAMGMRVTLAICAAFTIFSVSAPHIIMRIFTNDEAIIAAGTPYMRLIGATFLLAGLSSTATYLLRSVGNVRIAFIGSAISFFVNIFFNWVFIFGKFGMPRLELVGAAVGTIIARVFEFCFVFGYFIFKEDKFAFRLKHFFLPAGELRKDYIKYSIPVLVSDTLLGISLALTGVIVGHISAQLSAANSIVNSMVQLSCVLNSAMSGASAVIIGNTIGEGDIPRAKREGNSYVLLSFLIGLIIVGPMLLLEKPYISLYNIAEETRAMIHGMFILNAFMVPVQTIAFMTSKGILRGGGDTRFLLLADSTLVWIVSLPLGTLAGLVWHMSPVWIYFFLRIEFPLKGIVCLIRFLSGKWIKVISLKGTEAPAKT